MMEINGKTLVFTDCHLGLRNGSVGRLNTAIVVFRQMLKTIRDEGVSNVLFVGDEIVAADVCSVALNGFMRGVRQGAVISR